MSGGSGPEAMDVESINRHCDDLFTSNKILDIDCFLDLEECKDFSKKQSQEFDFAF